MTQISAPFEGLAISGRRVAATDGRTAPAYNPATGQVIAQVAQATAADIDTAVRAAHDRFTTGPWKAIRTRERGQLMQKLANLIREKSEMLAQIESKNGGKPISAARGEIGSVANTFEYYAGAVNKIHGQTIPVNANGTGLTFREPFGVCALIIPWNFPLVITAWKVAPALAMGNTVVIKPASATPLSALALADLALEAGFPEGVINVVTGSGSVAGSALIAHPLVRKISFTGSTEIGMGVMKQAADGIKRVSLELGGKSANVVFADANLDVCIESSIWAVYDNTGQDCCSRSRIFVERPIYDQFVERFTARTRELKVGDPADESTQLGPLITPEHRSKVLNYIQIGDAEGATRLCGGDVPTSGDLAAGNYMNPAVYVDVKPEMRIMAEEVFGPVVGIMPFEGEAEAIQFANDTPYGLSGSLWTRDIGRALRVARSIETGMLSINSSSSVHIEAPFGGMKQSGIGREQGMTALEHYSELKSVFIAND